MPCLFKIKRSSLDFVRGVSKLVSGFNVEFGGLDLALLSMAGVLELLYEYYFLFYH